MGYFSVGGREFLNRVVYPPFGWLLGGLRNLTGRQGRQKSAADAAVKANAKRRHMNLWKESHDR